jgi:hypothetical protein
MGATQAGATGWPKRKMVYERGRTLSREVRTRVARGRQFRFSRAPSSFYHGLIIRVAESCKRTLDAPHAEAKQHENVG